MSAQSGGDWSRIAERGSMFALKLAVGAIRSVGTGPLRILLTPVAGYFFLADGPARRASRDYLARIDRSRGGNGHVGIFEPYRHVYCFAQVILDRLALWAGQMDRFDFELHGREHMESLVAERKGALLIGAHIGSFDMLRLIAREADIPVNVVMYSENARQISEAFEALDPNSQVRVIDLDPTSAQTAFEIRRCLSRGEFVAVLGDRLRPSPRSRETTASFLGTEARFPQGPFLLSLVMQVPAILTVAIRTSDHHYDVYLEALADGTPVPSHERAKVVAERIQRYASRLEHYCLKAPLQWFNFYDFWGGGNDVER